MERYSIQQDKLEQLSLQLDHICYIFINKYYCVCVFIGNALILYLLHLFHVIMYSIFRIGSDWIRSLIHLFFPI